MRKYLVLVRFKDCYLDDGRLHDFILECEFPKQVGSRLKKAIRDFHGVESSDSYGLDDWIPSYVVEKIYEEVYSWKR